MAEDQLQQFLEKVRQLNAFVALSEVRPELRQALKECSDHHQVVALARRWGFSIGRRWGDLYDPRPASESILAGPCPPPGEELSCVLCRGPGWRLERIHSCQASSPEGFWYDQKEHEWVCLMQGSARLLFEDQAESLELVRGDVLKIKARRRHRLIATDPSPGTVWLALFWTARIT